MECTTCEIGKSLKTKKRERADLLTEQGQSRGIF